MAILGASKHPVLIKKISLSLWLLRDEVEAIIAKRLELSQGSSEKIDISQLTDEYAFTLQAQSLAQKNIDANESDDLDTGEDEMAAALAAAAEGDEEEASSEGEGQIGDSPIFVEQRKPILSPEKIISGSSFLAEINIDEMYLFAAKEFLIGQSIVIEFNIPRHFMINATVFYCRPYNMKSRIISNNPLPYRVGVKFTLSKDGERTLLREFLQSIEPDLEKYNTGAASEAGESEEDDDILDGLDDDL